MSNPPKPVITRAAFPADLAAISELHGRVFGPGRFARAAYRVREGTPKITRFCHVAEMGNRLIASLRMTDVTIGGTPGAALLGPLAVDPDFRDQGYGRQLVAEAMDDAKAAGVKLVVLVGDVPYYGRFGFAPVPAGQIVLPGPANPERILAAELAEGALQSYRGVVAAEMDAGNGGKS
jgi:predicted N-acetyltransferase YhbS